MTTMTPDPSTVWAIQSAVSLAVVFLFGVAISVEWVKLSPAWRRVLLVATLEHLVIAYVSWELRKVARLPELGAVLLVLTLTGLALTLGLLLLERRVHPVSFYPGERSATKGRR